MLGSLGKQIPVYQGMSVSNTALTAYGEDRITHTLAAEPLYAGGESDTVDIPEDLPEPPSDLFPRADMYFAAPGEDIYITVHIDNPDNFEILSFTLNGEKYSSYMFEEGSTMEELVLKVNVGEAEGYKKYTIDAIKYVDGEKIKDVRMQGDRTVTVGVAAERNRPLAELAPTEVTYTANSATVNIPDTLGLIRASGKAVKARLFKGDTQVAAKDITSLAEDKVTFDALTPGTEYLIDVVASYDAYDGDGIRERIIASNSYKTPLPLCITTEVRDAIGSEWCHLYGSLTCKTAEASLLSATYTKGTVSEAVSLQEGFLVPHGEGTLTVTYRYEGEEYTCALPILDGITVEGLGDYYTVEDTCAEGLYCHVSCYHAATAEDKNPAEFLPFLQ